MKLNHPLYLLHFFFKYHFLSLYPRFSVNREEMMPGKTKFIKKDISPGKAVPILWPGRSGRQKLIPIFGY
jgi:hypothetical protein